MYIFIHFGINTFTGNEWGEGDDDPSLFNPAKIDAKQWARVARDAGFAGLVFTAKHHEGFALWPTAYSDYSVESSPWRDGQGDVVQLVADASREMGIKFGVYLSPWDRHEDSYGSPAYHDFFVGQLTELLTGYGPVFEVWFDGAREPGIEFDYDRNRYYQTVREHQPDALIAIMGPDIRWVGNERGVAPETQWSPVSETHWHPVECDVPNRPGWFWRASEDDKVKSLDEHLTFYFDCVGHNGTLLLNVPPNSDGRFSDLDVERLEEFRAALDEIFAVNLMAGGRALESNRRAADEGWAGQNAVDGKVQTFWAVDDSVTTGTLEVELTAAMPFNTIELQEAIQYGQRVASYRVEALVGDTAWTAVSSGTTIGHKKLDQIPVTTASKVRLVVDSSKASFTIQEFGLYYDRYSASD